jgi:hypothetical protein
VQLYDVLTGESRLWKEFPYNPVMGGTRVRMTPSGDAWTLGELGTFTQLYVAEGLR